MKATLDRGVLAQDKVIRKHVRVIRTMDSTALELSHEMVWMSHQNRHSPVELIGAAY